MNFSTTDYSPAFTALNRTALNYTYIPPFTDVHVAIFATLLIFFLVFGIFANTLTIAVILSSPKLRNIFNHFILSLCVADLTSACISWIHLYRRTWGFDDWNIPNGFCQLYWGVDIWTSFVTALHIASFAILRFMCTWKPYVFNKITLFHAKIWIGTIWTLSFICGCIPSILLTSSVKRNRNSNKPISRWPTCTQTEETIPQYKIYAKVANSTFLYIPGIVVIIVTIAIIVVMKTRKSPVCENINKSVTREYAKKKEKQAIFQLLLIVGSFLFGYIPFTAYEFYTLYSHSNTQTAFENDWLFGITEYVLLRFSECLNPIFYNIASSKMRSHTIMFLRDTIHRIFCINEDATVEAKSYKTSSTFTA